MFGTMAAGYYQVEIAARVPDYANSWCLLATSAVSGALAAQLTSHPIVSKYIGIMCTAGNGAFAVGTAINNWIGGGNVSLGGIADGTFGACDYRGYVSIGSMYGTWYAVVSCALGL